MSDKKKHIAEIKSKLLWLFRKENLKEALKGINISIVAILFFNITASLLELAGLKSIDERTVVFYLAAIISFAFVVILVLFPGLKALGIAGKPNYQSLAEKVGIEYPEIKDKLKNVFQLTEAESGGTENNLITAAVEQIYNMVKEKDFTAAVSFSSLKRIFLISSSAVILSALLFALVPDMRAAAYRVINYDKEFIEVPKFKFLVEPGAAVINKGESVAVIVYALGKTPKSIYISTQSIDETSFKHKEVFADSSGRFTYKLNNIGASLKYYAHSGMVESGVFEIKVLNRPMISMFELNIIPPRYSRLPEILQKDNGNINALPGSVIKISGKSTRELLEAGLIFLSGEAIPLKVEKQNISGGFIVSREDEYRISIVDVNTNENVNPVKYNINLLSDDFPKIELISPDGDIKIKENNVLPLLSRISDDYGFSKMLLHYKLAQTRFGQPWENYKQQEIKINTDLKEDNIYHVWDLSPFYLAVDDVLSYYLEIFDNDNIRGPKASRTKIYTIRIPSIDEMFADADKSSEQAREEISQTIKEAEDLSRELEKISNELKQDSREISWEEKERIEKSLDKFMQLENKVEEIQKQIEESKKQLQENNLLSEETMKKYMELQDLMDQISSDELKEALKKMQEMLESLNRQNNQQALEQMRFNEEVFKQSLERSLNLLKRIQIEQKVDELIKRTEHIAEMTNDIMNEAGSENAGDESMNKQDEISKNIERLKEEMSSLKEKMEEFNDMPKEEMEKIIDEFEEQNNKELSENAKRQMRNKQNSEASQSQQQLSSNMQKTQEMLEQMQSGMQSQTQMQVFFDMMKALNNIVALSKEQETLLNETSASSPASQEYPQFAQRQAASQRNLDRVMKQLMELSQKSFAITPEMGRAVGMAKNEMSQALSALQNRNSSHTIQRQNAAMKHLNEAATLLQNGLQQMMSGGQGGGMMSLMQQMQQMSQQQMNLNQMTQQLNQGQLSAEQISQLQRLAQEQEMVRKSLEELNKEAQASGQSKKLSASLETILKEMTEVISNMRTEKINDELVQSQERILSKLLEAQRSINERDFEKERESKTGESFIRNSPPELMLQSEQGKDMLRDELMKAIREGYSKDYEEIIRKYYERLKGENSTGGSLK